MTPNFQDSRWPRRAGIALATVFALSGCNALSQVAASTGLSVGSGTVVPWPVPDASTDHATADGLKYSILVPGIASAATAAAGKTVAVNYAGWLTDGKLFDASFLHGSTFSFTLGAGNVIKGWDEGVAGMQVGERRKLVIPPELGYGSAGTTGIPGNSTLIFDVELISIK